MLVKFCRSVDLTCNTARATTRIPIWQWLLGKQAGKSLYNPLPLYITKKVAYLVLILWRRYNSWRKIGQSFNANGQPNSKYAENFCAIKIPIPVKILRISQIILVNLQDHCPQNAGLIATSRFTTGNIAYIEEMVPEPDRDSGSQRTFLLFKALAESDFTVFFYSKYGRHIKYEMAMRNIGGVIMPALPEYSWNFMLDGRCIYDAFIVSRRDLFSIVLPLIKAQCPGVPIIYDTGK